MIRLSLRRPVAVGMLYLALAVLGAVAWWRLPIELLPETELPRLTVRASWPGASPEATEAFLTAPLEAAVQQVRGVERVRSVSEARNGVGLASVEVEFARGTALDFARLELSERLAALEEALPREAAPPRVEAYVPQEFREQQRPFLRYTVSGPYTPEALRQLVEERIAPELRQLRGVAAVVASGGRQRLLEIELDEARVLALGLTPEAVRRRVAGLELVREAGAVHAGGRRLAVAIRQAAGSAAEVRRLPVLADRGRVVRLQDVARVRDDYEDAYSFYRIDGRPAVSFEVFREIGSNALTVADRAKAHLAGRAAGLPPGVRLILDDDESAAVRAQLGDLRDRALVGALIVFGVLLLFLRSARAAGVVFASIAFSVLLTLNLVYFGGLSLNVLTLMGLAMGFGLIIDNAVVVLETIQRRLEAGEPVDRAAEGGAREMLLPVLAATLTTVIVFVPFVYLQGELRLYYLPLALVVGFTNLASLFVSFSFTPALAKALLGRPRPAAALPRLSAVGYRPPATEALTPRPPLPQAGEGELMLRLPASLPLSQTWERGTGGEGAVHSAIRNPQSAIPRLYTALLRGTLRHPWLAVLAAGLLLGGSGYLFERNVTRGAVWQPWWGEDSYLQIEIELPRGEELRHTDELARYFEARLTRLPEVARFTTHVYPQAARIRVELPDSLLHTAAPLLLKEQLVAFSRQFGGAEVGVYGFGPSFYGGGASPPTYAIEVLGYNYQTVREIAEDLARRLQRFSRIREVDANASARWYERDRASEIVLRLDRRRLALHGLAARDVVERVGAAVGRLASGGAVRLAGEERRLRVRLTAHDRLDVQALQRLPIPATGGAAVRLADVAVLEERPVLGRIVREEQQYQRTVAYEFRGPVKLGDRVRDAVVRATRLPAGYTLVAEQEWQWSREERRQIYGVLAVSLLLVFMVTASLFESLRQPFVVLLTVPMALIGVFLTFYLTRASFTREAMIGVIMMGGVVVNNAMLLVDHVNRLRREEALPLEPALLRGARERARPILMTSAVTILGLLPLVLFSEAADANLWNALGYALLGGLASSTVLVLTVTPALYLLVERPRRRRAERAPRGGSASGAGVWP